MQRFCRPGPLEITPGFGLLTEMSLENLHHQRHDYPRLAVKPEHVRQHGYSMKYDIKQKTNVKLLFSKKKSLVHCISRKVSSVTLVLKL